MKDTQQHNVPIWVSLNILAAFVCLWLARWHIQMIEGKLDALQLRVSQLESRK